jgi:hypothetical protein
MAARDMLQGEGIPTAVVSMPCWSLFEAQARGLPHGVLGPGTVRVAVEAAVKFGWERWIGEDGAFVGMAGSAPRGRPSSCIAISGSRRRRWRRRRGLGSPPRGECILYTACLRLAAPPI